MHAYVLPHNTLDSPGLCACLITTTAVVPHDAATGSTRLPTMQRSFLGHWNVHVRLCVYMPTALPCTPQIEQGLGLLQNLCGHPTTQAHLVPLVGALHTLMSTHEGSRPVVAGTLACFHNLCGAGDYAVRRALADTVPTLVDALQDFGVEDPDTAEAALVGVSTCMSAPPFSLGSCRGSPCVETVTPFLCVPVRVCGNQRGPCCHPTGGT